MCLRMGLGFGKILSVCVGFFEFREVRLVWGNFNGKISICVGIIG